VEETPNNTCFCTENHTWTDLGLNFSSSEDEGSMFLQETTWRCNPQHC